MALIAVLKPMKDGGWEGSIRTLFINRAVRFVPNDNRESDIAPVFKIVAGRADLGVAWPPRTGRGGKQFFPVTLDDPSLPEAISAALFECETKTEAHLVWRREKEDAKRPSTG
jgi:uncharacterized protein (DUF736 family)